MAKKPTIEEFFSDPKFSEESKFFEEAVNFLVNKRVEEEKKKLKGEKKKGFFSFLFEDDSDEE